MTQALQAGLFILTLRQSHDPSEATRTKLELLLSWFIQVLLLHAAISATTYDLTVSANSGAAILGYGRLAARIRIRLIL